MTRRRLLVVAGAAAGLALVRGRMHDGPAQAAGAHAPPAHAAPPTIRLPVLTDNGAKVPVVVEVEHPMEMDHHVTTITVAFWLTFTLPMWAVIVLDSDRVEVSVAVATPFASVGPAG